MADFGWAFLSGAVTGVGPAETIQYLVSANGELTGSKNFTFDSDSNSLFLTGSMVISGTIQAHTFDVIHTNIIEISSSGATNFGNDSGDTHAFTGSLAIVSGSMRKQLNFMKIFKKIMIEALFIKDPWKLVMIVGLVVFHQERTLKKII